MPGNPDDMRLLWLSVVDQALRDAVSNDVKGKPDQTIARWQAQLWLEEGGADFVEVCTLAGVEPDRVRRRWQMIRETIGDGT